MMMIFTMLVILMEDKNLDILMINLINMLDHKEGDYAQWKN